MLYNSGYVFLTFSGEFFSEKDFDINLHTVFFMFLFDVLETLRTFTEQFTVLNFALLTSLSFALLQKCVVYYATYDH